MLHTHDKPQSSWVQRQNLRSALYELSPIGDPVEPLRPGDTEEDAQFYALAVSKYAKPLTQDELIHDGKAEADELADWADRTITNYEQS
jgi:hypothetical protein